MDILIVVLVSVITLILFGVGVYIVLQKNREEENSKEVMDKSGMYSVIRKSPAENIFNVKPTPAQVRSHLEALGTIGADQIDNLVNQWDNSIKNSIAMVEQGDAQGFNTYSFEFQDKDLKVCTFLEKDSYITREMIYSHPELLPPFYLGCTTVLISREAWDNQNKSAWIPILPVDGQFQVPDWRSFEK